MIQDLLYSSNQKSGAAAASSPEQASAAEPSVVIPSNKQIEQATAEHLVTPPATQAENATIQTAADVAFTTSRTARAEKAGVL